MNPALEGLGPSLIREINARKTADCIDLGLGEPVLQPDAEAFYRAADWVRAHGCPYSPIPGFDDLREPVASLHGAAPGQVLITHGSQEALYLALRTAIDPARDEVLLVEPCYPAYQKVCELEGLRWREVSLDPADGFRPEAQRVLAALRPETRLVVLGSPGNPTGRVWPEHELRRLCEGLGGRWLLCDEVYRALTWVDAPPSASEIYPRAFVAGGISKSHALTGLRLGWLVCPREATALATRAHQIITTSASTYAQRVAIELLATAAPLEAQRSAYLVRLRSLQASMASLQLAHIAPEGSFYCMVALPEGRWPDSRAAAFEVLERCAVVTVPGLAFGASSDGWLRISWVADPELVTTGLERLAAAFRGAGAATSGSGREVT